MGNKFAQCFNVKNTGDQTAASGLPPNSGPTKNRVTDQDKAILDLKSRIRKIKTYREKLENQEKEAMEKAKDLVKAGEKNRALIHLKKKKFLGKEMEKADGA